MSRGWHKITVIPANSIHDYALISRDDVLTDFFQFIIPKAKSYKQSMIELSNDIVNVPHGNGYEKIEKKRNVILKIFMESKPMICKVKYMNFWI